MCRNSSVDNTNRHKGIETKSVSGNIWIPVMVELCQRGLDRVGMPVELPLRIVVAILEGRGNVFNCSS